MSIEGAPTGESQTTKTEERVRDTFARLVYEKAQALSGKAFERVGINPDTLHPGVISDVTLKSADRRTTVTIKNEAQLRINEDTTRAITIRETKDGEEVFHCGRYVQPDGNMWVISDSSQGAPWYKADLSTEKLVGMVERMENLASSSYSIDITLSAYRPLDYRA